MVEMVIDEKAGWLHNHVFKYVENFWERPLAWVCRLFCWELKKENYKRRVTIESTGNEYTDEYETVLAQKDVIEKHRAAKLELALFVTLHVGFELFQRVLDIQKRI